MRVKKGRISNWQRRLTPTPKPEARPDQFKTRTIVLVITSAAGDWAKKMGRSTRPRPKITRTIYIHEAYPHPPRSSKWALSLALYSSEVSKEKSRYPFRIVSK